MQRRYALAGALALTTIVTFALIILGMEAGMFTDGSAAEEEQVAAVSPEDELAGALLYLAAQPTEAPAVAPADYYYQAEPRVTTEYVYVYETVPAPAQQRQAAAPTAPAPPPAPTAPAPEPTYDVEEPTPWPTEPPPPAQEPAAPAPDEDADEDGELEFRGTVTAVNGDQVTWSYNGGSITTRVVEDLDRLTVGTQAKVHAIRVSSGYVAKEIELGGDD